MSIALIAILLGFFLGAALGLCASRLFVFLSRATRVRRMQTKPKRRHAIRRKPQQPVTPHINLDEDGLGHQPPRSAPIREAFTETHDIDEDPYGSWIHERGLSSPSNSAIAEMASDDAMNAFSELS